MGTIILFIDVILEVGRAINIYATNALRATGDVNYPFYVGSVSYTHLNELLNACLHDFDMNEDIHLCELSMGQKKKVFMCFALATNTSLLVMDEPSNGLDTVSYTHLDVYKRQKVARELGSERRETVRSLSIVGV